MITPALQLKQRQGFAMTPKLAQSIRMLAMAPGELDALVANEVESNPFLARVGTGSNIRTRPLGNSADGALHTIEERVAQPPSRHEHLEAQIALAFRNAQDAALARFLASELDEAGYLRVANDELLRRTGASPSRLESVLDRCRAFEPRGVFARDLADCLRLQIAAKNCLDPAMDAMLSRLDLVAKRDFDALCELVGLEIDDITDMLAELRACDPKPLAGFDAPPAGLVSPCARITVDGAKFRVELVSSAVPQVRVDRDYAKTLAGGANGEVREWVTTHLASASWLERSLLQRARSILSVVTQVAERQGPFLREGEGALRPLTLRSVADVIGVHESTVSRVVAGKSIETPRGTVRLRAMFGAGVATDDGALAARAVQTRIADLIRSETLNTILSDEALTTLLRDDGINIARRTVAKYREGLGLGSSTQRRREKRGAVSRADAA